MSCVLLLCFCFFKCTGTTEIYTYGHTRSLHDALPISPVLVNSPRGATDRDRWSGTTTARGRLATRAEERRAVHERHSADRGAALVAGLSLAPVGVQIGRAHV